MMFCAWFGRASRCTLRYEITLPVACNSLHEKNTLKNHRTSFLIEVKSFVHQDAHDDMGKMRRCANVKQCKLKAWGVAVVDLWLFFEYHAEVKV